MIIVDFSQLCTAAYAMNASKHPDIQDDLDTFRHMVLNSLRYNNRQFREHFGEMVLAIDAPKSWRYSSFPYYKAQRKEQKAKSAIDWATLKKFTNTIQLEAKEFLPYRVVTADGAEGDDIIAAITRHNFQKRERTLIISSDKDFIQLQMLDDSGTADYIRQWDSIHEKWVSHADPARYLLEHVVKGDRGDGIPNAYSADDHYVVKTGKAKPITQKLLEQIWTQGPASSGLPAAGFKRNVELIDLRKTPQPIQNAILASLESSQTRDKKQLLNYMIANGLRELSKKIGEF